MKKYVVGLLVLLLVPLVSAMQVEMVSNTDQCLTNCETVYKITADEDFTFNETSFWFEFKDRINNKLRHANSVPWLKDFSLEYKTTKTEGVRDAHCTAWIQDKDNETQCTKWYYDQFTVNKTVWVDLTKTNKKILSGESLTLRIRAKKTPDFGSNIDNILVLKDADNERANLDGYVKYTEYAWFNTSWLERKNITITETSTENWVLTTFPYRQPCYNVTGINIASGNAWSEVRVTDGDIDQELPVDIISTDNSDWACIVVGGVNVTGSGTKILNVYYNNSAPSAPVEDILVTVDTAGEDKISGDNSIVTYVNATFDMDAGELSDFYMDNGTTNIWASGSQGFLNMVESTAQVIFGNTDSDDLCTITHTGNVSIHYVCEAGEDSNTDGDCDSGETCINYYFRPEHIYSEVVWQLAQDWNNQHYRVNSLFDGAWFYDSTSSTSNPIYDVATNGYAANDMTVTEELFFLWDEDRCANCDEMNYYNTGSNDRLYHGRTSGDVHRLSSAETSINTSFQIETKVANLNTQGQEWERRYDSPIESSVVLSGGENVPTTTDDNVNITNTITNPILETVNENITVDFLFGVNVTNVTDVNLTHNNIFYNSVFISGTATSAKYSVNNQIRIPLVNINATALVFNWTYIKRLNNGTNISESSSNFTQTVNFALFPSTSTVSSQIVETDNQTNNLLLRDFGANLTGVSIIATIDNNGTNTSKTTNLTQTSSLITYQFLQQTPRLGGTNSLTNVSVNIAEFFNISFGGDTLTRNLSNPRTVQNIGKMLLFNCGQGSNNVTINYFIRDAVTNTLLPTADVAATYTVFNQSQSNNRNFTLASINDDTPSICMLPDFGDLQANFSVSYGADGYANNNQIFSDIDLFVGTVNITLTLLNNSAGLTNITIFVVDEDDNEVQGVVVSAELFNGTAFTFIASDITDFQGKVIAELDLNDKYRINITKNGQLLTLTNGLPASVGPFTIITPTLTFRVLLGAGGGLTPLLGILNLQHNLTCPGGKNCSTSNFTLDFNDVEDVAGNICLTVTHTNITGTTQIGQNCSSSNFGSLIVFIGGLQGSFQGIASAVSNIDSRTYIFNTLDIIRGAFDRFGNEGTIWTIILTGTLAAVGLVVTGMNPAGAVVGAIVGVGASAAIGILTIAWGIILGLVVIGGILLWLFKT